MQKTIIYAWWNVETWKAFCAKQLISNMSNLSSSSEVLRVNIPLLPVKFGHWVLSSSSIEILGHRNAFKNITFWKTSRNGYFKNHQIKESSHISRFLLNIRWFYTSEMPIHLIKVLTTMTKHFLKVTKNNRTFSISE